MGKNKQTQHKTTTKAKSPLFKGSWDGGKYLPQCPKIEYVCIILYFTWRPTPASTTNPWGGGLLVRLCSPIVFADWWNRTFVIIHAQIYIYSLVYIKELYNICLPISFKHIQCYLSFFILYLLWHSLPDNFFIFFHFFFLHFCSLIAFSRYSPPHS